MDHSVTVEMRTYYTKYPSWNTENSEGKTLFIRQSSPGKHTNRRLCESLKLLAKETQREEKLSGLYQTTSLFCLPSAINQLNVPMLAAKDRR